MLKFSAILWKSRPWQLLVVQFLIVFVCSGCDSSSSEITDTYKISKVYDIEHYRVKTSDINPIQSHTATLLDDGSVLIVGGLHSRSGGDNSGRLRTTVIYNPNDNFFHIASELAPLFPNYHSATKLADGNVLITGGIQLLPLNAAFLYITKEQKFTRLNSSLNTGRFGHNSVLLPDGRVLITGGFDDINSTAPIASAEIYHPDSKTFELLPNEMTMARGDHTTTLLDNGLVLIVGDNGSDYFNPENNSFTQLNPNRGIPRGHTANKLSDGSVLFIGNQVLGDTMIKFDPLTETFTSLTQKFPGRRNRHTSTMLVSGKLLVIGGDIDQNSLIFDPVSFQSSPVNPGIETALYSHASSKLNDGNVLFTGGVYLDTNDKLQISGDAELYDTVNHKVYKSQSAMSMARAFHTSTLLKNGKVLVAGGSDWTNTWDSVEIFDPDFNTFTLHEHILTTPREGHSATLLNDGRILICGGDTDTAEIYDPIKNSSVQLSAKLSVIRKNHTAMLLDNGNVILSGGMTSPDGYYYTFVDTLEIFDVQSEKFQVTSGHMIRSRTEHTSTLLNDGTILHIGGQPDFDLLGYSDSAEIFDQKNNYYKAAKNINLGYLARHTATLLNDDSILITGGINEILGPTNTVTYIYPVPVQNN